MVIDTSALIAILLEEPAAIRPCLAIRSAGERRLSASSLVEAALVVQKRFGDPGQTALDRLLSTWRSRSPFTERHTAVARTALMRFGKGLHSAELNYGDCFPYALARALGEPLLFVGDDFSKTNIQIAPYSLPRFRLEQVVGAVGLLARAAYRAARSPNASGGSSFEPVAPPSVSPSNPPNRAS